MTSSGPQSAALYRTSVPAATVLVGGNTLCAKGHDATWIVFLRSPGYQAREASLSLAVSSGPQAPKLAPAVMAHTMTLCGTFGYIGNFESELPT